MIYIDKADATIDIKFYARESVTVSEVVFISKLDNSTFTVSSGSITQDATTGEYKFSVNGNTISFSAGEVLDMFVTNGGGYDREENIAYYTLATVYSGTIEGLNTGEYTEQAPSNDPNEYITL